MIKVFTKEKISEVIITHLFTREEINQYFDGNVFIDHPELNPQDYIVLDENNFNVNNIKIKQEQKAKDEASQTQIGRVNVNE